jgi:hypothetical protein
MRWPKRKGSHASLTEVKARLDEAVTDGLPGGGRTVGRPGNSIDWQAAWSDSAERSWASQPARRAVADDGTEAGS